MIECKSRNGKLTYTMKSNSHTTPFEVVPNASVPFAEWYRPETGDFFDGEGRLVANDLVLRMKSASMPSAEYYNPETGTYLDGYGRLIVDGEVSRAEDAIQRLSGGPSGNSALPATNAFEYSESLGDGPNGRDFPLPARATKGSVGYDLFSPYDRAVTVPAHGYAEFPLGIRCRIKPGEFLLILPRSSMGFNGRHVSLTNTAGVIDSDYYGNASNGGEISIRLFNASDEDYAIPPHGRVAQAIFLKYDLADGDSAGGRRDGGFGSTGD